jgi:hypothetical protein
MNDQTPLRCAHLLARATNVPAELVAELLAVHEHQWDLEDASRSPTAADCAIASAKRNIDVSNDRRHRLIDKIDGHVLALPTCPAPTLYTETIGELCDRLLILHVKLVRAVDGSTVHEAEERLLRLTAATCHMASAINQLINHLRAGRAYLPPRAGVKIYKFEREGSHARNGR